MTTPEPLSPELEALIQRAMQLGGDERWRDGADFDASTARRACRHFARLLREAGWLREEVVHG